MIEILVSFIVAVLTLLTIPVPDMALVVANGVAYGKQRAFFFVGYQKDSLKLQPELDNCCDITN